MLNIRWMNQDPILDLKIANLTTIRLRPKDNAMSPESFWRKLLSRHSTLRVLSLAVFDDAMDDSVAMHMVRHTRDHCQPAVSSKRPDWNGGKERDPDEQRWYFEKFTPIGLIKAMEQRTCARAEIHDQDWAARLIYKMEHGMDPYMKEIAKECKPRCEKLGWCPEELKHSCGRFPQLPYEG